MHRHIYIKIVLYFDKGLLNSLLRRIRLKHGIQDNANYHHFSFLQHVNLLVIAVLLHIYLLGILFYYIHLYPYKNLSLTAHNNLNILYHKFCFRYTAKACKTRIILLFSCNFAHNIFQSPTLHKSRASFFKGCLLLRQPLKCVSFLSEIRAKPIRLQRQNHRGFMPLFPDRSPLPPDRARCSGQFHPQRRFPAPR